MQRRTRAYFPAPARGSCDHVLPDGCQPVLMFDRIAVMRLGKVIQIENGDRDLTCREPRSILSVACLVYRTVSIGSAGH